ncbi:MAG: ribokinase [Proteobacteria bacterium]|nr:ribokinase [Pseudomonadota bacterium]
MIVVFGSINVDLVFALAALPRPGETVLGDSYRVVPGGKGANQAVAAARDGAEVRMIGRVGEDGFGQIALDSLARADVDVSGVAKDAGPTGCAAVCVDGDGRNLIAVASGANRNAAAKQVGDDLLTRATTLLLQMEVPAAETAVLIRRARARGCRIVLNLAPALPLADEALRAVDVLVVNETEAASLVQARGIATTEPLMTARALAEMLGTTAVLTLGAAGAIAAGRDGTWAVDALAITPVDTTAAGDAFVGVLGAALDRGATLPQALHRASVAAGLACQVAGAQPSLPLRTAIDARRLALAPPRRMPG